MYHWRTRWQLRDIFLFNLQFEDGVTLQVQLQFTVDQIVKVSKWTRCENHFSRFYDFPALQYDGKTGVILILFIFAIPSISVIFVIFGDADSYVILVRDPSSNSLALAGPDQVPDADPPWLIMYKSTWGRRIMSV